MTDVASRTLSIESALKQWIAAGELDGDVTASDGSIKLSVDPFFWGEDDDGERIFVGELAINFDIANDNARLTLTSSDCVIAQKALLADASLIVNEINQCCQRGHFEVRARPIKKSGRQTRAKPSKSNPTGKPDVDAGVWFRYGASIRGISSQNAVTDVIDELVNGAEEEFGYPTRFQIWERLGKLPVNEIIDGFYNESDIFPPMVLVTGKVLY